MSEHLESLQRAPIFVFLLQGIIKNNPIARHKEKCVMQVAWQTGKKRQWSLRKQCFHISAVPIMSDKVTSDHLVYFY